MLKTMIRVLRTVLKQWVSVMNIGPWAVLHPKQLQAKPSDLFLLIIIFKNNIYWSQKWKWSCQGWGCEIITLHHVIGSDLYLPIEWLKLTSDNASAAAFCIITKCSLFKFSLYLHTIIQMLIMQKLPLNPH